MTRKHRAATAVRIAVDTVLLAVALGAGVLVCVAAAGLTGPTLP